MTLTELGKFVSEQFTRTYGHAPHWLAAAPGRVNIIGEHTDYNDGFVFPMAIDRYTVIAGGESNGKANRIELRSTVGGPAAEIDLGSPLKPARKGTWFNYPLGVVAGFGARGFKLQPFQALIHSTVPLGGGLSSSAA